MSAVAVEITLRKDQRIRDYSVEGADPITTGSGSQRCQFVPQAVHVVFDGDGTLGYLSITGPRIRKDGSVGIAQGYASFCDDDLKWGHRGNLADLPDWTRPLIVYDTPKADAS